MVRADGGEMYIMARPLVEKVMNKEYDKVNALVGPKETARYNANKAFEEASYRFNSYYYPEPNSN